MLSQSMFFRKISNLISQTQNHSTSITFPDMLLITFIVTISRLNVHISLCFCLQDLNISFSFMIGLHFQVEVSISSISIWESNRLLTPTLIHRINWVPKGSVKKVCFTVIVLFFLTSSLNAVKRWQIVVR